MESAARVMYNKGFVYMFLISCFYSLKIRNDAIVLYKIAEVLLEQNLFGMLSWLHRTNMPQGGHSL